MHFAKCSVLHSKTSSIKIGETNGWILFWVLTRLRQKSKEAEELATAGRECDWGRPGLGLGQAVPGRGSWRMAVAMA